MRTHSQRLLSMVLALSMLLTFLPVSAFAEGTPPPYAGLLTLENNNTYPIDVPGQGTYTYTLNDDNTATLTKFTGTTADVPETVTKDRKPYTVTAIGADAFAIRTNSESNPYSNNLQLTSVTLPDSISSIGQHAFAYCVEITSIKIPSRVTNLEGYVFSECKKLGNVTFQEGLTSIGEHAFYGCKELKSISLPDSLTEVKDGAFMFASLETIDWPENLTTVGSLAFYNMMDFGYDSSGQPTHSNKPIKTITYHGTKAQWDEMARTLDFVNTNPQLVPKDTEHPNGVDLHCAHTVTFNKNGHGDPEDQVVDKQVVEYEGHASKPSDPTADGFTFKGWYTASEGGEKFNFNTEIIEDTELFAHWEEKTTPEKPSQPTTPEQPGTNPPQQPNPPQQNPDKPTPPENTDKPNEPTPPQKPDTNKPGTQENPNDPTTPEQPGTPEKPNEPTPPEAPAVEEDDTAAIGYVAAAVTVAFVGWGAYRIGSQVYLKYLLPKDVLLPQNRLQLAELLWEDAGRPAPADAAPYADVDDTDAQQAARWAVENGLLTLPDTEKPEEFAPYRSVSYAKSARAWNKAQQLKENAAR